MTGTRELSSKDVEQLKTRLNDLKVFKSKYQLEMKKHGTVSQELRELNTEYHRVYKLLRSAQGELTYDQAYYRKNRAARIKACLECRAKSKK